MRLQPPNRIALWGGLLLAVLLPLLLYGLLFGVSAGLLALALQFVLAFLVGLVRLPPRYLTRGLLAALALLLLGALVERGLSRYVWQTSDKAGLVHALSQLGRNTVSQYGFRSWSAPPTNRAAFTFEARLLSGSPGWDWFRSDSRFVLEPHLTGGAPFTRVYPPADGEGYLMRTFDLGEPIGGRRFRVLLDLRDPGGPARTPIRAAEVAADPIASGDPVGGARCRGVALQAWSQGGRGRCLPVTLDAEWARYSLSWRVPEGVASSVVRVVLSGSDSFDVRRVKLFVGGRELGPLMPQGASAQVAWAGQPEAQSGYAFTPTESWRRYTLRVSRTGGGDADTLTARLFTGSDVVLETRGAAVRAPSGTPVPALSSSRQTILFGDPNLAGHTVATLGLALLCLTRTFPVGFGGALLTLSGVALTGSRAALLGAALGLPWLLLLLAPRRRLFAAAVGVLLPATLALGWGAARRLLGAHQVTARTDIWGAALEAFTAHPLRGLGADGFPAYWADTRGGEAVQHAHNLWLTLASSYGVFGLLAALLLTAGLTCLAWRWGGSRGLALVTSVLVMNLFDTTLFYAGVLFPLVLALGALREGARPASQPRSFRSRRLERGS